jgi:hypothetical protein
MFESLTAPWNIFEAPFVNFSGCFEWPTGTRLGIRHRPIVEATHGGDCSVSPRTCPSTSPFSVALADERRIALPMESFDIFENRPAADATPYTCAFAAADRAASRSAFSRGSSTRWKPIRFIA